MALLLLTASWPALSGAPSSAPQVLLAITNSESMDGSTSGAIMVGSGSLGSTSSSLSASSSPTSFTIPSGFTPPVSAGGSGTAPYTATCNGSMLCDNSPSRMNLTKAAISQVLNSYGSSLNFGVYTYNTGSPSLYTTWAYYMSPSGGFTFTNTPSSTTVANPCYQYGSASATVKSNCTSIDAQYSASITSFAYMNIAATSDAAQINDVLYSGGSPSVFLTYGTVSPTNPYAYYSLSTYNTNIGGYSVSYSATAPTVGAGGWATTPTNAGYVPYSSQVIYSMRGFGYGASQSATTGSVAVPMGTDPTTSSAFTTALAPETNSTSSGEIKSAAGQSAIYALMTGARSYLSSLSKATCQNQYVVLLTDGLPTLDKSGSAWPPLGTTTAVAYSLTATFNGDGSFASSNSQAVTDAVNSVTALSNAGISVFVIGLGAGVDPSVNPMAAKVLQAMAIAGGTTNYYPATDTTSLNNAFQSIAKTIYSINSIAAPVAPISVAGGSAYEYELTSVSSPTTGHVLAFPVTSGGVATSTAAWDAAQLMTTTNRGTALIAPLTTNAMATLGALDAAAFNLTPTTCVPNTATIVNYTVNPAYSGACSYLAGRDSSSLLGGFGTQNSGYFLNPPGSSLLTQKYAGYVSYARGLRSRPTALLFSDSDGFIYSVNASTGALNWGWSSRNIVAKLQNYASFATSGATNGGFTVVDALDGGGSWNSYLVGSFQSGGEHFVVKLDSTGKPATLVYDAVIAAGTAAGDKSGATGAVPLHQPPVIAYIGSAAYYIYVVTVGTTSTLYETNVGTGTTTSTALSFQVTSALTLNSNGNQLWLGGADGSVRVITLTSGTAAADAAQIQTIGNTVVPSNGTSAGSVLYVGYTEVAGVPYVYALNSAELTVFGITTRGWTPLWASTPTSGWTFSSPTWSSSGTVAPLTSLSVVSDQPVVVGSALLVPVTVPGSGCSAGSGYYDLFSFANGSFPSNVRLAVNGVNLTANYYVGVGTAYAPSLTLISGGISLNPGSAGNLTPSTPLVNNGTLSSKAISWQRR